MRNASTEFMIRHTRSHRRWPGIPAALVLLLILSSLASAEESLPDPLQDPDWCNCPAILNSESEALREQLVAETRERQSACRESLGVSVEKQRKGQGARLDACHCRCLDADAEPAEGPWGEKRKPG